MALTPDDIRDKQFNTVRLREGYDKEEVDLFLDAVELAFRKIISENSMSKSAVDKLQSGLLSLQQGIATQIDDDINSNYNTNNVGNNLSADDIRDKQFNTVRLREGYDQEEVDLFLDAIELEFRKIISENSMLKKKIETLKAAILSLQSQQQGGHVDNDTSSTYNTNNLNNTNNNLSAFSTVGNSNSNYEDIENRNDNSHIQQDYSGIDSINNSRIADQPFVKNMFNNDQSVVVDNINMKQSQSKIIEPVGNQYNNSSQKAVQVLNIAQDTADKILHNAKYKAKQMLLDAKNRAEQMVNSARIKSESMNNEAHEKYAISLGNLENKKTELTDKINTLRSFEYKYRECLRAFIKGHLNRIASQDDAQLAISNDQVNSNDNLLLKDNNSQITNENSLFDINLNTSSLNNNSINNNSMNNHSNNNSMNNQNFRTDKNINDSGISDMRDIIDSFDTVANVSQDIDLDNLTNSSILHRVPLRSDLEDDESSTNLNKKDWRNLE